MLFRSIGMGNLTQEVTSTLSLLDEYIHRTDDKLETSEALEKFKMYCQTRGPTYFECDHQILGEIIKMRLKDKKEQEDMYRLDVISKTILRAARQFYDKKLEQMY